MISVIITSENIRGNRITVDDKSDVNHLKNAFRVKIGEEIRAVDGEKEYICEVADVSKKEVVLEIKRTFEDRYSLNTRIDAAIGILKNDKMDLTIQKLTEIGINKLIPLMTKRGVVKLSEKKDKWDLVVREALKQCQGVRPMVIDEITRLDKLDINGYDLVILPYECEEEYTLKNLLGKQTGEIKKVLYIIGPEGGFDIEEVQELKEKGANAVTLGKRILRAETASIVVGGVLTNEFQ